MKSSSNLKNSITELTWIKAKKTLLMHAIDNKSSEFDLKQDSQ